MTVWVIPAIDYIYFDQGKKNEIQHHSWKEHLRMSKTAKFGCEIFTGLYFPHFTTIRDQTLQFYSFYDALFLAVVMDFILLV
jgi:hypothetical protein